MAELRVDRRFNRANLSLRSSFERRLKLQWIAPHFFFLFELSLRETAIKDLVRGSQVGLVRFSQKPLAVAALTVQNDRAPS